MTHKLTVILTIISLCLVACVPGHNDYSEFVNMPSYGWDYRQPAEFRPTLTDSLAEGELVIAIRHSNAYPYSNIWLEMRRYSSDSKIMTIDTMNVQMADIYGHWYGKGLGTSYQISDTLPASIVISKDSRIQIRHIMRPDTLPSIEQIGILFKGA